MLDDCDPKPSCKDIPDLQHHMNNIAVKLPTLGHLEKKLDLMNDLHPKLEKLESDIESITDMDDMRLAKQGSKAIRTILDYTYPANPGNGELKVAYVPSKYEP